MGKTHQQARGNIVADNDGYGPYLLAGGVNCKAGVVTFEDDAPRTLFTLPAGAIIVNAVVNVSEAFNDGSASVLDLGLGADDDGLAVALDVEATGQITSGFVPGALFTPLEEETDITATYTGTAEDATAGAATVAVFYILF